MDLTVRHLLEDAGENYIFPFLWMHGEDESVLRHYMQVISEANIGAVCVESRPHPDFAGPGWWHDMDIILEEAKQRNMKVWILDDSHFPTGYANGAMAGAPDELRRQNLAIHCVAAVEGGKDVLVDLTPYRMAPEWKPVPAEQYNMGLHPVKIFKDDRIISITAVREQGISGKDIINLTGQKNEEKLQMVLPKGQWKIYICYITHNRGPHRDYINMLDKRSCKLLIDGVYEPHYARYGNEFGKTIAGFFSDEPELGNGHLYETGKRIYELDDQPWSIEVEETLRHLWGEDFEKYLPLLWDQDFSQDITARIRWCFMDVVTRTVEQDFSMQIGQWCRNHGVMYIGHLIEDNGQHTRTGSSLGHYFRGLSGQDMAGIDDIGGQVLPQGEWTGPYGLWGEVRCGEFYHYVLGKLAASLAAVDPLKKGRSVCEIFGNYGWSEGVRLEKYLADHFLVRGINHFVPHAFSPKAFPDPDCPPHFYAHGHNPQYRHFGALMKYMNRMCALLSHGKHISLAAVLYSAESEWTGAVSMELYEPAQYLADHQIDYDFIPGDVFKDREYFSTKTEKGLEVNGHMYRALVIPEADYIPLAVARAALELEEGGTKVYFINRLPKGCCDGKMPEEVGRFKPVRLSDLVRVLTKDKIPEIFINPHNDRIRYIHYEGETSRYMFVNEGTCTYRGLIRVPDRGTCYQYNAWDNVLETLNYEEKDDGTWITGEIEPGKPMIVIFDKADRLLKLPVRLSEGPIPWNKGWMRSICTSVQYPEFSLAVPVSLPDHLEKEKPCFSGFVRYENIYRCGQKPDQVVLEITDASEGVEVFVDRISAGIQICPPFVYDLTSLIHEGENLITIEVATTLEREMSQQPDPIRSYMGLEPEKPQCASGINGKIFVKEEHYGKA